MTPYAREIRTRRWLARRQNLHRPQYNSRQARLAPGPNRTRSFDTKDATTYAERMVTTVRIRNVPVEFQRRLKARAASEGLSMSDYVMREVGTSLDRAARAEVLARLRAQPVRRLKWSPVDVLRKVRADR